MRQESKFGSARYAAELAQVYEDASENGLRVLGGDLDLCVEALRFYAHRWWRRAGAVAIVASVAALAIGLPDQNGDGRVDLRDLFAVAHAIASAPPGR